METQFKTHTMTQRECPLVTKLGTPTTDCDITLPLKSGFQELNKKLRKFRREVEQRWIRGRGGGPAEQEQGARAEPVEQVGQGRG